MTGEGIGVGRSDLPRLGDRPSEPMDRLWWGAMPIFYLVMTGYGLTAAIFPIRSVAAVNGYDRATVFGIAIAVCGVLLLYGTYRAIWLQRPQIEMWSTALFLVLMAFYMAALYVAVENGEPNARPGSSFLPLLFSVFPFTRLLVIVRSGRVAWVRRLATRWRGRGSR